MGGNYDGRAYATEDRAEIERQFASAQAQSREEDGRSYSGAIGSLSGKIARWHDRKFSTFHEAAEWLEEHADKGTAEAVSFYVSERPGEAQQAARDAAAAAVEEAEKKFEVGTRVVLDALRSGSGERGRVRKEYAPCRGCGSSLRRDKLRDIRCPLCTMLLTTRVQDAHLLRLEKELSDARAGLEAAEKPVPSKKVGWLVGGVCPS